MTYRIRVIDTETTGIPTELVKHGLVELGYTDMHISGALSTNDFECRIDPPQGFLINPGRPIPPDACGVHHITDEDVADAPSADRIFIKIYEPAINCFAAHNAEFDRQFYGGGDTPWICTKRAAIMGVQDAPDNRNQTLRYFFGVDKEPDFDKAFALRPHRAPDDSYVTAFVLRAMIRHGLTGAQMMDWTANPILLPKFTMNPHKGLTWDQVPKSFINWAMSKSDIRNDRDFAHTARFWLRQ